jgi:hypothetical protein
MQTLQQPAATTADSEALDLHDRKYDVYMTENMEAAALLVTQTLQQPAGATAAGA